MNNNSDELFVLWRMKCDTVNNFTLFKLNIAFTIFNDQIRNNNLIYMNNLI